MTSLILATEALTAAMSDIDKAVRAISEARELLHQLVPEVGSPQQEIVFKTIDSQLRDAIQLIIPVC